jgi:hypothetical protein
MVTLEKLARPDFVEGRFTDLNEGRVPGGLPAEITSLDDPEKIGRIQVCCPLIDANANLPNGDDGWVHVIELFTNNATPGGDHRLLHVGSQVILLPILGFPNQMVLLGCIPNRVDRPSPEVNRTEGLYGHQTQNGVYKIRNDKEQSEINAFPHGVAQHISGTGDITQQTKEGARQQLKSDGTVRNENPKSSTTLSPDGTVETRNAAAGTSVLNKDGNWEIKSKNQASLKLNDGDAVMEGPKSQLGSLVSDLKKQLAGPLGQGEALVRQINGIKDSLGQMNLDKVLQDLPRAITSVQDIIQSFPTTLDTLKKISAFPVSELGDSLLPQAKQLLDSGLGEIIPILHETLAKPGSIEEKAEAVLSKLKLKVWDKLPSKTELSQILTGLDGQPDIQAQAITSLVVPGGFEATKNVFGLGLGSTLAKLDTHFNPTPTSQPLNSTTPRSISSLGDVQSVLAELRLNSDQTQLNLRTILDLSHAEQGAIAHSTTSSGTELRGVQTYLKQLINKEIPDLLPPQLKSLFGKEDITNLIELALTGGNPMSMLLGQSASKLMGDLAPTLLQGVGMGQAIAPVQQLLSSLQSGNLDGVEHLIEKVLPGADISKALSGGVQGIINDILPHALGGLTGQLGGLFGGAKDKANFAFNALNSAAKGGTIRATKDKVEAIADSSLPTAKMVITRAKAALVAQTGLAEVFAGGSTAGLSTPFGSFGFGAGGGSLLSKGMMAMRIAQDVGKSAGLLLHPKSGVSLASFADSNFDPDKADQWSRKTAEITVDEGNVYIASHGSGHDGIAVTPDGVYLEGWRVRSLVDRLTDLESSFAQLSVQSVVGDLMGGAIIP